MRSWKKGIGSGGGLYHLDYSFSTPEKKQEYEEHMKKHRSDLENYREQIKNDQLQNIKMGALAGAVCGIASSIIFTITDWPAN